MLFPVEPLVQEQTSGKIGEGSVVGIGCQKSAWFIKTRQILSEQRISQWIPDTSLRNAAKTHFMLVFSSLTTAMKLLLVGV